MKKKRKNLKARRKEIMKISAKINEIEKIHGENQ